MKAVRKKKKRKWHLSEPIGTANLPNKSFSQKPHSSLRVLKLLLRGSGSTRAGMKKQQMIRKYKEKENNHNEEKWFSYKYERTLHSSREIRVNSKVRSFLWYLLFFPQIQCLKHCCFLNVELHNFTAEISKLKMKWTWSYIKNQWRIKSKVGGKDISNDSRFLSRNHEARGKKHTIFQMLQKERRKNCNWAEPHGSIFRTDSSPHILCYSSSLNT